jgi:hypothetical protein
MVWAKRDPFFNPEVRVGFQHFMPGVTVEDVFECDKPPALLASIPKVVIFHGFHRTPRAISINSSIHSFGMGPSCG